jgi:hypothetical protein
VSAGKVRVAVALAGAGSGLEIAVKPGEYSG